MTIYKPPEIILNANKTLCAGQTLSLMEIILWTQPELASEWTLPDGQVQNDSPFIFNVQASDAGDYTLQAIDQTGCSDQKTLHLEVSPIPIADFHGSDTLTVPSGYLLDAGQGYASYNWNTGDSTQSIQIETEGWYKVEMESQAGCLGSDSVYILLQAEQEPAKYLYIPNAFTPDGDGMNDYFAPVPTTAQISEFQNSDLRSLGSLILRKQKPQSRLGRQQRPQSRTGRGLRLQDQLYN